MSSNEGGDPRPKPPEGGSLLDRDRQGFWLDLFEQERVFLMVVSALLIATGLIFPYAGVARWFGFGLAAYSAVANDSIQTLGTFLASNRDKPWWALWIFIGTLFLATVCFSWWQYDGDVSYERLESKGFATAPTSFTYLQVAAPILLMILTRLRIPVSTSGRAIWICRRGRRAATARRSGGRCTACSRSSGSPTVPA